MCLEESQKVPLELTRAVREAAGHFCFEQCPVCWLFAHYTTYGDIVQGREVRVGPLSQLMIAGAAGCRFAASLVVGLTQQAGDNVSHPPRLAATQTYPYTQQGRC